MPRRKRYTGRVSFVGVLNLQATADGKPKTFSMVAYTGGPLRVKGFPLPVIVDLSAGSGIGEQRPALRDHDQGRPVGHLYARVSGSPPILEADGVISQPTQDAVEIIEAAANGFEWKTSIGCDVLRCDEIREGGKVAVNGRTFEGPVLVAREWALREISVLAIGADANTSLSIAAKAAEGLPMTFEEYVASLGLTLADLTPEAVAALQTAHGAMAAPPVDAAAPPAAPAPAPAAAAGIVNLAAAADPVAEMRASAAAEATRLAKVQSLFAGRYPDLQAQAISGGWSEDKIADQIELRILREGRPKPPAGHSAHREDSGRVMEAAFAGSAGLRNLDKHYTPEVLEKANRFRGFGLQQAILAAAAQGGYSGMQKITTGNCREVLQAAFSTHSLTTLLTTTGNKLLLDGFNAVPQSWREVAQVRSVNDFKAVTAFRLTASLEYEELGGDGEIKHGTVGQESYDIQAKTYAKLLALTRTDIVNDDLGAFNSIRERLGLGAAIKMNKVFWTAWLAASNAGTFWTSARGNLVTSSALAEAGLNTAVAAFRDMAGPDGNMMSLEPAAILVPSALEATARKIYTAQEVRDTTSSTKFFTANIYQNRFVPIVVPELGNSSYTGYSATTWFLLADPAVLASAIMCFLNGQEAPTIDSADADFDQLGIQFRGYHDFGASVSEYRASVKATA